MILTAYAAATQICSVNGAQGTMQPIKVRKAGLSTQPTVSASLPPAMSDSQDQSYLDRFSVQTAQRVTRRSVRSSRKPTIDDLKALLREATSIRLTQPDLAVNLEVADMVNEIKGQAPQVVCKYVTSYLTFFRGITSMLALSVLDVCVKNCGYAFHLVIASKEFLNKLVRSFTYRPSTYQSSMVLLILQMIEEWNQTLAKTSVYRDDMGNIRDMHRLLASRGYVFPEIKESELSALSPEQNSLKSASELEAEERERQSIKMQMLLGSKKPEDLKEANRLMSILAGYREPQVDYKAKVAADLERLRRAYDLLSSSVTSGIDPGTPTDVFDDLAQSLKSALPKLKHLLKSEASEEEDSEAHARVSTLLEDIETVLAQYRAAVNGEPVENVPKSKSGSEAGAVSLIDIDGEDAPSDDLLALGSLSIGPSTSNILEINAQQTSQAPQKQQATQKPAIQAPKAPQNDLLDIFGSSAAPSLSESPALSASPALPVSPAHSSPSLSASSGLPASSTTPLSKTLWADETLHISYTAEKSPSVTVLHLLLTNPGSKKITSLETQLAQPRSLTMELGPISQTQLESSQSAHQRVVLKGETAPKLRWKATYNYGLEKRTVNGDLKNV